MSAVAAVGPAINVPPVPKKVSLATAKVERDNVVSPRETPKRHMAEVVDLQVEAPSFPRILGVTIAIVAGVLGAMGGAIVTDALKE